MRIFAHLRGSILRAPSDGVSLAPITLEELSICLNTAPRLASTMNVPVLSKIDPTAVIPALQPLGRNLRRHIGTRDDCIQITNRIAAFARGAFRNTTEKRRVSSRISSVLRAATR